MATSQYLGVAPKARGIDTVGDHWGTFWQSSGAGKSWINGRTGNVGPVLDLYDEACGRKGLYTADFGLAQMTYQHQYSPSVDNRIMFDIGLDMTRAGYVRQSNNQFAAADRVEYWSKAAAGTDFVFQKTNSDGSVTTVTHNLDTYVLDEARKLVSNGVDKVLVRFSRESPSLSNECPIASDGEAYDSVTFWRRVLPQFKKICNDGGINEVIMCWNACGGPETQYANQLKGFPGWDICNAVGPDIYAAPAISTFPIVPLWKNVTMKYDSAVGDMEIIRNGNQAPVVQGDIMIVGVGTTTPERVVVDRSATVNGEVHIYFKTALTKIHKAGHRATKEYVTGERCHYLGVVLQSKVDGNTEPPSENSHEETAYWDPIPWQEWGDTLQAKAIDAWKKAFRRGWYGENTSGVVDAKFFGQYWYDFAAGTLDISNETFDPRVDKSLYRRVDFYIPEFGVIGRKTTQGASSGDAWVWMGMLFAWSTAMKLRDGYGMRGCYLWCHDNGYDYWGDIPVSVYSSVFPNIKGTQISAGPTGTTAPGRFFPEAGDRWVKQMHPAAQPRMFRDKFGNYSWPGK